MGDKELPMEVDDDNKSSSSKSSDLDDDSEEQELLSKAKQLEAQLSENKFLYDIHAEIVEVYRKLGDLGSLREAYKRFHEYFPLTPALWLTWLKDEISVANTPEQQKELFSLFEEAAEDYLSVDIWMEYAQFSIGASDLNTTRSILEKGLMAAGLVCDKGSLLWDTLRELEHAHISLHPEGSEVWKGQVQKLADVFKRQLSVPLIDMENTYQEWQIWMKTLPDGLVDPQPIEYGYNKAIKLLETYKPLEESLLSCASLDDLFKAYKIYIKAVSDPSTVICLYERAAVQLCLVPDFWFNYCVYAFKLGDAALTVSKKAVRNCPWSEELWILRMRILENLKKSDKEIMECFEQGLSSISPTPGLELWLTYLEYTHRCVKSPEKLDKLFHQAAEQLRFHDDPSSKVGRWYSRILAHDGDMKAARKIWSNHILAKSDNKGSASLWLEYANLEREYGEPYMLRTLFQKALNAVKDWPQYILDEWLMYERQFGTLEDVFKCVQKCREINAKYAEKCQQAQNQYEVKDYDKGKKRHRDVKEEADRRNKKAKDARIEEKREAASRNKVPINKSPDKTVFVSNIHVSVDESKLQTLFPNAVNIEVVRDKHGKSRCFGYVQFNTQEEVAVALARDREPLSGRPVFISELKAERAQRKPAFKYSQTVENNKLFIKGLPTDKSTEEIEDIFKKYNAKDIRIVFKKSGESKGIAYVEFETEEKAMKAMKELDQTKIDDHVISVAISAPPPKKTVKIPKSDEPSRHARSRLEVPLIPRALQIKNKAAKDDNVNGGGSESSSKPKTNSDFRNMLLNKSKQ